jgi:hypothetical protein
MMCFDVVCVAQFGDVTSDVTNPPTVMPHSTANFHFFALNVCNETCL